MAKFTPGPWRLGTLDITPFGTGFSMGIDADTHGELATVVWQMEEDKHDNKRSIGCEANARLIAKSPELFAALTSLVLFTNPTKRNAAALAYAHRILKEAESV